MRAPIVGLEALASELGLAAPGPVLDAVAELYREVDQAVAAGSLDAALPCRAGCDACCKESVFLSAPEFLFVVAHLRAHWAPSELRHLLEAMDRLAVRFEDELELLETIQPGPERDEVAARVKFDCPFLTEGRCRIYPARELNARTFGASWDTQRGEAYGCELTHARLRLLPPERGPALADARAMRRLLAARLAGTERVHVYPWWFRRHRAALERLWFAVV